jgi:antitoxin component YwqK of YwqJK toxin-antitoxin module
MSDEVKWDRGHYTNGQLWWEIPWVNGRRHGIAKCWYSDGQLMWETPYVNGEKHGIGRCWYENGQLRLEIPYVNDQWHGIRKYWSEDGKLWSIAKWHRGQKLINLRFGPILGDVTMELDLITNEMSYE